MTKQEYERVRQEVAKKYKDRISELEMQNQRLAEMIIETRREKDRLELQVVTYERKLNSIPESLRSIMTMCDHLF